jgi:hypothetical protein
MLHKHSKSLLLVAMLCTPVSAEQLVALLNGPAGKGGFVNGLTTFDSDMPGTISAPVEITGLEPTARILGIDFRPLTGQLYALSSENAIYTVDYTSGAATLVGEGFNDDLDGTFFGFDFNPVIDRIRIVSDTGQNFVAHPDTGLANVAATTDVFYAAGDVNEGAAPHVVHHAYDGVVDGALSPATQLRAIDSELDILVTQANNAGTLETIGDLTADAGDMGGFDIASSGAAFATFPFGGGGGPRRVSGGTISGWRLYSINLETGVAEGMGDIELDSELIDVAGLAVVPGPAIPEPSSLLLVAAALVMGVGKRWRSH